MKGTPCLSTQQSNWAKRIINIRCSTKIAHQSLKTVFPELYQQQQRKEDKAKEHKGLRVTDKQNRFRYMPGHILVLFYYNKHKQLTTPKTWNTIWVRQSSKSQKMIQVCYIAVLIPGVSPTVKVPPRIYQSIVCSLKITHLKPCVTSGRWNATHLTE